MYGVHVCCQRVSASSSLYERFPLTLLIASGLNSWQQQTYLLYPPWVGPVTGPPARSMRSECVNLIGPSRSEGVLMRLDLMELIRPSRSGGGVLMRLNFMELIRPSRSGGC